METIFTNTRIVSRDDIILGTVVVEDGLIKDMDTSVFLGNGAVNLEGDLLLPGLVEMHTDNLEKNIQPRPGVIWPSILSAALAHDTQIAGAGITTVFDAIAVGGLRESSLRSRIFNQSVEALSRGREKDIFKADHFLHLRCEVADDQMEAMLLQHCSNHGVRLISIMDHTPGQRQWSDLDKWRLYHRDKQWTDKEVEATMANCREMQKRYGPANRKLAVAIAREKQIPLASHDDTTKEDIAAAAGEGIRIAEFPTTLAAAQEAEKREMATIMGAPNAVRGRSHSGNISASELAEKKLLNGLSSDYVPTSLLQAVFYLADKLQKPLHQTVAMATCNISEILGMKDRGELAPGKRADMLQVSMLDHLPVLKRVWKKGRQIA
jgi:alpha-D-ribose 1-methylphosphonate 5-triphosphate diphosphatase